MKLVKVGVSNVRCCQPYFLRCSLCDVIVEGSSVDEVVAKARVQNFKYDYENDVVVCSSCLDVYH